MKSLGYQHLSVFCLYQPGLSVSTWPVSITSVSVRSLKLHFFLRELQSWPWASTARLHVNHPLFKGSFGNWNWLLDSPRNSIWKISCNDGGLDPLQDPGPRLPSASSASPWLTTFGYCLKHSDLCQEGSRKCQGTCSVPLRLTAWWQVWDTLSAKRGSPISCGSLSVHRSERDSCRQHTEEWNLIGVMTDKPTRKHTL